MATRRKRQPRCPDCTKALYKAPRGVKARVKPEDPYAWCRNPKCGHYNVPRVESRFSPQSESEPGVSEPGEAKTVEREDGPGDSPPESAPKPPPQEPPTTIPHPAGEAKEVAEIREQVRRQLFIFRGTRGDDAVIMLAKIALEEMEKMGLSLKKT